MQTGWYTRLGLYALTMRLWRPLGSELLNCLLYAYYALSTNFSLQY